MATDSGNPNEERRNPLRLESVVRSDSLPEMLELARKIPALAPLVRNVVQIRLVLDANIVQGELRWRLRRRRNSAARSSLHEAIAAGVVIPYAPTFLDAEISEHEERIAKETGSSVVDVRREWQDFRTLLRFYLPSTQMSQRSGVVDEDDLPYIAACAELGATAVYSRDAHVRQMNAPVIHIAIDTTLRAYARANAVRIGVAIGSTFTVTLTFEGIAGVCRAVKRAVAWFERLHPAVQIGIVAALVIVLAHPKCREKLSGAWQTLKDFAGPTLLPMIADVAAQFAVAAQNADAAYKEIQRVLPAELKRSALMHARAVCLISKGPLSLSEIERRIRAEGYVTRARDFSSYLRRLLRSSGQFAETSPGVWALSG